MLRLALALAFILSATAALAADAGPVTAPADAPAPHAGGAPPPGVTAVTRYNEGEAFAKQQMWKHAENAYLDATKLKPELAEAWNGLGHARKMQKEYPDALAAYEQALRLKPNFPQALEYLGETYVAMGRLDDARATLTKLKPLDATLAEKLSQAIDDGKRAQAW